MNTTIAEPPRPSPAPKPAAPPVAPKTGSPQPEPSARFEIPSLDDLTRPKGTAVDDPLKGIVPKPGESNPLPTPKPADALPIIKDDDDEEGEGIDTNITPQPKKPKDQIIAERRKAKAERMGIPDLEKQINESREQLTKVQAELEQERTDRKKDQEEREQFKSLATQREEDLKSVNERYIEAFKPQFDANQDKELIDAHQSLFGALSAEMPEYVRNADGAKERVMFNQLAGNPNVAMHLETAVARYATAQQQGDTKTMDLVVNSVLSLLGAPVAIKGIDHPQNVLLDSNDDEFVKVESALKKAIPGFVAKAKRLDHIKNHAPELIEQKIKGRESNIRTMLSTELLLKHEDVQSRLSQNPTDSIALFSAVLNGAPALKQLVEASIVQMAPILASVPERLELPPLKQNDAASVAAHRGMVSDRQKKLAEFANFAVIGRNVGPILASLIAERDDAAKRAAAAARNTNPGPHEPGEHGPTPQPRIPTNIAPEG